MRKMFEDIELKKNHTFCTEEAARHVVRRWTATFDAEPEEINAGGCETFAAAVIVARAHTGSSSPLEIVGCEIGGYDVLHDRWGGHVWVYDHETQLHHDAEAPQGTKEWKTLPAFQCRQA
jgi:hypothetical protein